MPDTNALFTPPAAGSLQPAHRVWMAPLTRSRSTQPGDIPNDMNAEYYRQRANPATGAAVIIAEATQVSPQGKGYAFTPGIHTDEQVAGWKKVTDAVHAEGGTIVLQLWHVGRISHTALQPDGGKPVAPSAIRADAKTYISKDSGMVDVSEPRALETSEIPGIVEQFRTGAQRAKDAGFDGVEIHGANGYLLDQFLRSASNRRTDDYGGSIEHRAHLPLKVTEAVVDVWGPAHVGYRVTPYGANNTDPSDDPKETFGYLARALGAMGLAYIHVVEELGGAARTPETEPTYDEIREAFKSTGGSAYVANGAYTPESAAARVEAGKADAIAFGKLFIPNPDLALRIKRGGPYNEWDQSTFYGGTEKGYTDYPALEAASA